MRLSARHGLNVTLGALGLAGVTLASTGAAAQDGANAGLEEVVVTAQRREERLSDVPISLSAFSQERLDAQGVRSIDDVARLTPGVIFSRTDQRNGLASNIAIRGISSTAGASTTGIYIDDTPIQIRSLGYSSFNSFPQVFDVERVEVLRGPQGTLFGAGSQGGTVRFITPQPSLLGSDAYVRSEIGYTQGGDSSFEGGAAFGTPLIENRLAMRASGWFRRDGGWVDRVDWDRATRTPTNVVDENSNWQNSAVGKFALLFTPFDSLRIVPSVYYQDLELNDTPTFWASLSAPDRGEFNNGNALSAKSKDKFYLPALKVEWDFGGATLVSNTSYFNRENRSINDYSAFEAGIWTGDPFFPAGNHALALQINRQNNITQEIRLQSDVPEARLGWVIGAFYTHARQTAKQFVQNVFLPDLFEASTGVPFEAVFGQGLADGLYTFVADPIVSRDEQTALFGQLDFKLSDELTLTAGLRASKTKVTAQADYRGPVVGPTVSDSGSQEEEPITPKLGVSYKLDADNMVYASAAKGFRIGGYNPRVGVPCNGQLASLGLTEAPPLYESDSVWSYEVGAKNAFAGGRVRLSSSVYYIDWTDIQQSVALASCGFTFVANLGSAVSQGFDVQAEWQIGDDLNVSLAVGYTDAEFDETVRGGPAAPSNLVTEGDRIVGSPWTGAVAAQYNFTAFGQSDGYARVDYQYQSRQSDLTPGTNQQNGAFNPNNVFSVPRTNLLSMRVGTRWSGLDVSLFANNLLDSDTVLSQAASPGAIPLYQLSTFRPRTYGITVGYRY